MYAAGWYCRFASPGDAAGAEVQCHVREDAAIHVLEEGQVSRQSGGDRLSPG
jgi:hypothetical protein